MRSKPLQAFKAQQTHMDTLRGQPLNSAAFDESHASVMTYLLPAACCLPCSSCNCSHVGCHQGRLPVR